MTRPMIENSDRGITINKPLAWSILVAIVAAVWFGGTTVASLQTSAERLGDDIALNRNAMVTDRASAAAIEGRVRALENASSRQDARFDALSRDLDEIKGAQREQNNLLRQLLQTGRVE